MLEPCRPPEVAVSMASARLRRPMPLPPRSSTVSISCWSERARRSSRQTTGVSPARLSSSAARSCGRSRCAPEARSVKTRSHPAAVRASSWRARSRPRVLRRAAPTRRRSPRTHRQRAPSEGLFQGTVLGYPQPDEEAGPRDRRSGLQKTPVFEMFDVGRNADYRVGRRMRCSPTATGSGPTPPGRSSPSPPSACG